MIYGPRYIISLRYLGWVTNCEPGAFRERFGYKATRRASGTDMISYNATRSAPGTEINLTADRVPR